jgi:hypothetical protein
LRVAADVTGRYDPSVVVCGDPMEDKLVQSWLDIVAKYLTFSLRFPRSPAAALKKYKGSGKVESELVSFAIAGLGLSYLFVLLIAPKELAEDKGALVGWLRGTDLKLLPPVLLLSAAAGAVILHITARLVIKLDRPTRGARRHRLAPFLGGSIEDSVNAALAFAAFMVPIVVLTFLLELGWAVHHVDGHGASTAYVVGVTGVAIALASIVLFCLALAALHRRTTCVNAFSALCGVSGVLCVAAWVLSWFE